VGVRPRTGAGLWVTPSGVQGLFALGRKIEGLVGSIERMFGAASSGNGHGLGFGWRATIAECAGGLGL
jgi:hypothetical protein